MRSVRTLRSGLAAAVVAWKLAALALLPAALCCRAVMAAEGTAAPACCAEGEHGASCPMRRGGAEEKDAAPQQPRIAGCGSLDDALVCHNGTRSCWVSPHTWPSFRVLLSSCTLLAISTSCLI